jgi:indole-3-glycerol phosphate synthase
MSYRSDVDRQTVLAASREEARRLAGQSVSEVIPSRRDFAQYVATQKQELAVIARLSAAPPRPIADLVAHARACDDADVAALAVATGAVGLSLEAMAAIAAATTAPILRDDLMLAPSQLYHARLHGADAAVLPAAELDDVSLDELLRIASSLHMAAVVEVVDETDAARAARLPHVIAGLRCLKAGGGLDLDRTCRLLDRLPAQATVIVLPEVTSAAQSRALHGKCDAVMVGEALPPGGDISATLRCLTAANED